MVKEIQPIGRSVGFPTQTVQAGNAFEKMGDAAGQLSTVLSQKLNTAAVEQASQQGVKAAEKGEAPKSLAPPLTPATKAFNESVADTEANRMILSAQSLISESFLNHTNPANFDKQSPARFRAEMDGIIEGTLQNARDENRGKISQSLQQMSTKASLNMLSESIEFDNRKMQNDFTTMMESLTKQRQDAVIAGDDELTTSLDLMMDSEMENFGNMNKAIKEKLPEVKKSIDRTKLIQNQLGEFSKAKSEGKGPEFLADFIDNKQNLPFDVWQDASNKILQLDATDKKLKNDLSAQEFTQVSNAIENGTLTDVDSLLDFPNLSTNQQLRAMHLLDEQEKKNAKQQSRFLDAQANFVRGTGAFVSGDTINEMFDASRAQAEQQTGKLQNIFDMEQSILGKNEAPVTGISGVNPGRSVPKFNSQIKSMLEKGTPEQTAAAASVYNDIVNVEKKPKLLDISGKALSIASAYNTLNTGGEDPAQLAERVQKTVMDTTNETFKERQDFLTREFRVKAGGTSKYDDNFKETFGVKHQIGVNDSAFGAYKENFKLHFLNTGDEEASKKATAYDMRNWQQSKWYPQGMVQQASPEVEMPVLTQTGNAFQNQLNTRVQSYINKQQSAKNPDINIEWESPTEQQIDLNNLTDEDRVFKKLGFNIGRERLESVFQEKPQVKINGERTEVSLMPTPDTRLGERLEYALYYKDKFGELQPLPDTTNPSGVARFSPDGLDKWAPSFAEEKREEQLKQNAINLTKEQAKQKWKSLGGLGALGKIFPNADAKAKFLRDPQNASDLLRTMASGDEDEATRIIKLKQQKLDKGKAKSPEQQLASSKTQPDKADHVGISFDSQNDRGQ